MCVCIFILFELRFSYTYLNHKRHSKKIQSENITRLLFYADVEEKGLFNFPYKVYT